MSSRSPVYADTGDLLVALETLRLFGLQPPGLQKGNELFGLVAGNSLEQHVVCKCSYQNVCYHTLPCPALWGKASPHEKGTLWLTAPPGLPGGMFYTAPENSLIMNGVVPEGRSYSLQKGNAFLPHFHLHLPNSRLCRSISDTPLWKDAGACRLLWVFNST